MIPTTNKNNNKDRWMQFLLLLLLTSSRMNHESPRDGLRFMNEFSRAYASMVFSQIFSKTLMKNVEDDLSKDERCPNNVHKRIVTPYYLDLLSLFLLFLLSFDHCPNELFIHHNYGFGRSMSTVSDIGLVEPTTSWFTFR